MLFSLEVILLSVALPAHCMQCASTFADDIIGLVYAEIIAALISKRWQYRAGVGKLSSEMHLSLWNAISCPSRQLALVTFKGDYAILALRNYKMQAEKRYSYLTILKLLIPFGSMKHSRDSLEMQFVLCKAITVTLLHSMYFRWNGVPLSCIWHSVFTALRVAVLQ